MFVNQRDPQELVQIFNSLFKEKEKTILLMGADEPFYRASVFDDYSQINAREDFFSSALHEIAHWTIAGKERRKLDDYGYWYLPEGRNNEQQQAFEKVEIKPQAIEWLFSIASGQEFHFSADNLANDIGTSNTFKIAVRQQAKSYLRNGLPIRAQFMFDHLKNKYSSGKEITEEDITGIELARES